MWHSGSKCQKIGALVKVNYKRLKAALALGVRKLGPAFLVSKLGELSLFDGFLDLANYLTFEFSDLDNFRPFDNFPNFLTSSSPSPLIPDLTTSPLAFPTSGSDMSSDLVVFSIEMSEAAILLKPWINYQ